MSGTITFKVFRESEYIHSPATLLGTAVQLFNCLVTQIANQPITWQQLNTFRHLDVVKMPC